MANFDESQLEAVQSDAKHLLVLAGAGTGKTTMLLGRVAYLVQRGADPTSILALTFTNAAACEMRSRYADQYGSTAPTFATFHAFCYRLILNDRAIADKIGYGGVYPRVATEFDEKRIREKCRKELNIRLSDKKLNGIQPITQKEKFYYDIFWKRYGAMLRNEGLITFDTMCKAVCDLFLRDDSSILKYKQKFKHIFVDEFQDTDKTQWEFVESFGQSNITVVGDAKQNLYRFRGCSNDIIKKLSESPDWKTVKLYHNYRSTKQICQYANRIHDREWGDTPYNLKLESDRDGAHIDWKQHTIEDGNATAADDVLALTSGLYDGKSIAILCRTNAEVDEISEFLDRCNIQYARNNVNSDREHILKSGFSDEYFMRWVPTNLPAKEYGDYIRASYLDNTLSTVSGFTSAFGKILSKLIFQINRIRTVMQSDAPLSQKYMQVGDILRIKPSGSFNAESESDILKYYLKACEQHSYGGSLYIGTIHSVKGLEYDNVHVIGVDGKYFRLSNEDNLNCFYVACTRAKEKLTIWMGDTL